jgi:hypothetical protein
LYQREAEGADRQIVRRPRSSRLAQARSGEQEPHSPLSATAAYATPDAQENDGSPRSQIGYLATTRA